jgi:hypothetical protein
MSASPLGDDATILLEYSRLGEGQMSPAAALGVAAILFPALIGVLARLEKLFGPRFFRWLRSLFRTNARTS